MTMTERSIHLKIKIVNLADEARTIRAEERKALRRHRKEHDNGDGSLRPENSNCELYAGLRNHRVTIVRSAARVNQLAYGFLRGVPYAAVEAYARSSPNFPEVRKIALRFSVEGAWDEAAWRDWEDAGRKHLIEVAATRLVKAKALALSAVGAA